MKVITTGYDQQVKDRIERLSKAFKAIKDGYPYNVTITLGRWFLCVENPDHKEDTGIDPLLVIELKV